MTNVFRRYASYPSARTFFSKQMSTNEGCDCALIATNLSSRIGRLANRKRWQCIEKLITRLRRGTAPRHLLTNPSISSPISVYITQIKNYIDKNTKGLSSRTRSLQPCHQYQPGPHRNLFLILRPDHRRLRHRSGHRHRLLRTSYLDYPALG